VVAVSWLRKAAEQNYVEAQRDLGVCYQDGTGVQQDYGEAVKWCRKAAEQGDDLAQYGLGCRYAKGQGVEKDQAEAYKWMLLAAAQGDSRIIKYKTLLKANLSPEQLAEGKRRANDWLKQHKKT
jgi:TPR repeat protein